MAGKLATARCERQAETSLPVVSCRYARTSAWELMLVSGQRLNAHRDAPETPPEHSSNLTIPSLLTLVC